MNNLLFSKIHSNPILINHLYISITKDPISAMLLEHIANQAMENHKSIFAIDLKNIEKTFRLYGNELKQSIKKINKLPFITIATGQSNLNITIDTNKLNNYIDEVVA